MIWMSPSCGVWISVFSSGEFPVPPNFWPSSRRRDGAPQQNLPASGWRLTNHQSKVLDTSNPKYFWYFKMLQNGSGNYGRVGPIPVSHWYPMVSQLLPAIQFRASAWRGSAPLTTLLDLCLWASRQDSSSRRSRGSQGSGENAGEPQRMV